MKAFLLDLAAMQPSQLYVSAAKLEAVRRAIDPRHPGAVEPVPVKRLGDAVVCTDGHTRALPAHEAGLKQIPAVWDEDELDWEAYEICVAWCRDEGIRSIADLAGRVVDAGTYETLWLDRCRRMHAALKRKRDANGGHR